MSDERVVLLYDDGSKIDFNNEDDAVYHLSQQGVAGVLRLVGEASQEETADRAELEARVAAQRAAAEE